MHPPDRPVRLRRGLPRIPGVLTVAATGGMQQEAPHFQINEFVRLAAEQMGGAPYFIHAPYLPSAELRTALMNDAAIRGGLALWDRVDAAILGIGLPRGGAALPGGEPVAGEAAGDVIRHYFDIEGRPVEWQGESRMIARISMMAAGVTPSIACACAIVAGRRSFSLWRISMERPGKSR